MQLRNHLLLCDALRNAITSIKLITNFLIKNLHNNLALLMQYFGEKYCDLVKGILSPF